MKTQLKHSFFQVFCASTVWLIFILTTFFKREQTVSINFIWNIAGVALICALLFCMLYTALWNHWTLKPVWNVLIASFANTAGGLLALLLLAQDVFFMVWPWTPAILVLSLILHTVAFYFYAKHKSAKDAKLLNQKLEEN